MRFDLARVFRSGLLVLVLSLLGCGQSTSLSPEPTSLSLDEALAQVETVDLSSLDPETQLELRDSFKSMLRASGQARFTSKAPVIGPVDLTVLDNGDGTATFSWSYRNRGDYDQNSEANIADLTPLAVHLNHATTDGDHDPIDMVIDGDNNTQINIAELSPLGAGLLNRVDSYRLEISTNGGTDWSSVTDIEFADSVIPGNGGFRQFTIDISSPVDGALYQVVSVGAGEDGGASNSVEYTPGAAGQIENLTATQGTLAEAIELNWDAFPGALEYEVQRADSATGPFSFLITVGSGVTTWPHASTPDVHYWYRVIARDGAGPISGWSDPAEGWASVAPQQIANLVATQGTVAGQVDLTWDSHPDAGFGYGVYRGDTATGPWVLLDSTITNAYSDSTALPGVYYWYQVEGYTLEGPFGMSAPAEGWAQAQGSAPTLTMIPPPAVGSGSAVDPYLVPASSSWSFVLEDSNDGDVTLSGTYILSDIAELSINGDDLLIDDNPALNFNFYGSYNGQDSNTVYFQLDAGAAPPTLSLINPPPVGTGTAADPYVVPPDSDFNFSLFDVNDGDVTGSGIYSISDPAVTISGSTLLVGSNPPPDFWFFGTYAGVDSNWLYFHVDAGVSTLVIFPHFIDPNWFMVPNYGDPDAGQQTNPFIMHDSTFNPDTDFDGVCDANFMLMAEDNGNPVDNEILEWGCFPPNIAADINDIGSRGQFHVTSSPISGYVFAQDASLNESNHLYIEIFP